MSKEDVVALEVGQDVVRPIIEKQIQARITEELGGAQQFIERMVKIALSVKVGEDGHRAQYSSDNKYDFLEAVTGHAIRNAAKALVHEFLETQSTELKKAMLAELNRPSRQKSITKAFVDAAEHAFKCNWNFKCEFVFDK